MPTQLQSHLTASDDTAEDFIILILDGLRINPTKIHQNAKSFFADRMVTSSDQPFSRTQSNPRPLAQIARIRHLC